MLLALLGRGVAMIKFKACPRCGGDLSLEQDQYGVYWVCCQCAHLLEVRASVIARREAA